MRFDWDPDKNTANIAKHGVAFEQAQSAFYDENGMLFDDPDHSADEDRFLLLAATTAGRLLLIVHCYRDRDEVIRLISARPATARERTTYATQGARP